MPKKETFKERLLEESIWIMLVLFFGLITIWATFNIITELNYYFNGVKCEGKLTSDGTIVRFEVEGKEYDIDVTDVIYQEGKDILDVYYFPGKEDRAIVLTSWKWWVLSYTITLPFVVWGAIMLYKNFRKRRIVKQKFQYEKREVDNEERGRLIYAEFASHNKNLYEKHETNPSFETIKYKKEYDSNSEIAKEIIVEQDKLWKVGTVYLGVVGTEKVLTNGVHRVVYTSSDKYLKDPGSFLKIARDGSVQSNGTDIFVTCTIVEKEKLPFGGEKNDFYLVVAKPGLCKYAILLPEWYYLKEEVEVM